MCLLHTATLDTTPYTKWWIFYYRKSRRRQRRRPICLTDTAARGFFQAARLTAEDIVVLRCHSPFTTLTLNSVVVFSFVHALARPFVRSYFACAYLTSGVRVRIYIYICAVYSLYCQTQAHNEHCVIYRIACEWYIRGIGDSAQS